MGGHPGGRHSDQKSANCGAIDWANAAASALSFSIGMQVGVTVVNTMVGLAAMMIVFGTMRPAAIRAGLRRSRG